MKSNIFKISVGIFVTIAIFLSLYSCKQKSEKELLYEEITNKEEKLWKNKTEAIDKDKAIEMIRLYVSYADKYAKDSLSPEYLFRASEIAENANQPNNAITYLTRIENIYKDYTNYSICIIRKAFIYDTHLKDPKKARIYYEKYINEYPNGEFAEDAKWSLTFLGVNDDQLIEIVEGLNKGESK